MFGFLVDGCKNFVAAFLYNFSFEGTLNQLQSTSVTGIDYHQD